VCQFFHPFHTSQIGLLGEQLQAYKGENSSGIEWSQLGNIKEQTLVWYKVK